MLSDKRSNSRCLRVGVGVVPCGPRTGAPPRGSQAVAARLLRERGVEGGPKRRESLPNIADSYFNVETEKQESLQSIADFLFNVEIKQPLFISTLK